MTAKRFDTIEVQLYDGQIVVGKVVAVEETVGGPKLRVLVTSLLLRIDPAQVLLVLEKAQGGCARLR